MPSTKQILEILNDIKNYEPVKVDVWSSYNRKTLWYATSEKLVKSTDSGYQLTEHGRGFLSSNLDYEVWILPFLRDRIAKKQSCRFILLYELFKLSNGDISSAVSFISIADDRNIKDIRYNEAKCYLENEGLIRIIDKDEEIVAITHEGKKIIELSIMFPDLRAAQYFPALKDAL